MTFYTGSETLLRDALDCCSASATLYHPTRQHYGRGVIVGMVALWTAFGYSSSVVEAVIRNCLPKNLDPECLPPDFQDVYTPGRFMVREHINGFSLEDTKTGQTHWLSDGVDCVSYSDDGDWISPGTLGFCEMWANDMNGDEATTLEAYFPETFAKENEQ
jgi:hypothetical protein